MSGTTPSDVHAFLRRFAAAAERVGLNIWPTQKTNDFLLESGFTNADIERVVRDLRVDHYHRGPETDDSPRRSPGEVWKFGREFEGYHLYVKLKLDETSGTPSAECLSFHETEAGMRTPFRSPRRRRK